MSLMDMPRESPEEGASDYEQRVADDVARFLAGEAFEEDDSDAEEPPAPTPAALAPTAATELPQSAEYVAAMHNVASYLPHAEQDFHSSLPTEEGFAVLPSESSEYVESSSSVPVTGQASLFAPVHSSSQAAALFTAPYSAPAAMKTMSHLSDPSNDIQDQLLSRLPTAAASIFSSLAAKAPAAAPAVSAKAPAPPATAPHCASTPLSAQFNPATRERTTPASNFQPAQPVRRQAMIPGPISPTPTNSTPQHAISGNNFFNDLLAPSRNGTTLLGKMVSASDMNPLERGQVLTQALNAWPLPFGAEHLKPLHEVIYGVLLQIYADGIEPSVYNVEKTLRAQNLERPRGSVVQVCLHFPQFYLIWMSCKFKTYILLRDQPLDAARLPRQDGVRPRSQAHANAYNYDDGVRRYTGVDSQMTELNPPQQSNPVDANALLAAVAAAAASAAPAVERSPSTNETWDAYCPKCFQTWLQIPNFSGAVCRACNAKLLEIPKREGQGCEGDVNEDYDEYDTAQLAAMDGAEYAEEGDEEEMAASVTAMSHLVYPEADVSDMAGGDGKNSKGLHNSERIAHVILEHGYTTLMIRNLSMRMRQKHLLKEIDTSGFEDKYDYAHLPVTFGKGSRTSGVGYAFVNFMKVEDAAQFVMVWHGQRRAGVSRSDMAITISHAEMQGKEANAVNWMRRGCHIRNPGLRPFIKGHCEAIEEHERKKALSFVQPDPTAPPSLPPGLIFDPSSAETAMGDSDADAVRTLPPGLVKASPGADSAEGFAFPDVCAALSSFAGSSSSMTVGTMPSDMQGQATSRWQFSLDAVARIFSPSA